MITEERKVRIMELIRTNGFVSVRELMKLFGVSRSSVMRDLEELRQQGYVYRQRGGASLRNTDELMSRFNEPAVREKETMNSAEKRLVCKSACELVRDGNNIYIDSGTTVLWMREFLKEREINIVTPNTLLLTKVPESFKGNIILLGGDYSSRLESVSGIITDEMLGNYSFDYAFLTANGIDFEKGEVYGYNVAYSHNKKTVLARTRKAELLIDSSKSHLKGFCKWADIGEFENIFIDEYKGDNAPDNLVICKKKEVEL